MSESREPALYEKDTYARRLSGPLYRFFERIWFSVKLHFCILAGLLVGLVLFGYGPSMLAAHHVIRLSLEGREPPMGEAFIRVYREKFSSANRDSLPLLLLLPVFFGIWYGLWYVRIPIVASLAYLLFFLLLIAHLLCFIYWPVFRAYDPQRTSWNLYLLCIVFGLRYIFTSLIALGVVSLIVLGSQLLPHFAVLISLGLIPWTIHYLTWRKNTPFTKSN